MTTYECPICLSINHVSKLQCSNCGTIPSRYSLLGGPARQVNDYDFSRFIPVVPAYGCYRAAQHHAQRVTLKTVSLDYYAE